MRFTRVIAAAALAFAAFTGVAMAKDWKVIRIGTEGAYPPFNGFDTAGNLVGFDVDIAKALCEKMQATCTFQAQDWDGIIPALLAGKFDAIVASMSITEERQKKVAFSNKYYQTPPVFVAPKDSRITSWDAAGLKGKVIGAQSSTIHGNFLEGEIQPGGAEIKFYGTQDEANADLAAGRLDAVVADKTVLSAWLAKPEASCCERKADIDVVKYAKYFGAGVGVAMRKEDTDLVDKFNKAIAEILADGTYKKVNAKYFPFSIY